MSATDLDLELRSRRAGTGTAGQESGALVSLKFDPLRRLGYFNKKKMRIELAREHADHPLLRRVSAHSDVERQMMSAFIWSTCMKRLVAQ